MQKWCKITAECGYTWTTSINGTDDEDNWTDLEPEELPTNFAQFKYRIKR